MDSALSCLQHGESGRCHACLSIYAKSNWSGAVSFWLRLDPDTDLEAGYCDPLQNTPREWNDAAFWVDFSKDERPRHFRLGAPVVGCGRLADTRFSQP